MKAKEWYAKFEACTTEEQFQQELDTCLRSLVKEANDLISKRKCKTSDAMAACINEIDNKWFAIKRIHDKNKKNREWYHPVLSHAELLEDGFKAVYVQLHPKNKWFFNLDKHKKMVDEREREIKEKKKEVEHFTPYVVTPYENLTMENLVQEILCCTMALGKYVQVGIPIMSLKPLANRIALLKYWYAKKEINMDDLEEFKKDEQAWVKAHMMYGGQA